MIYIAPKSEWTESGRVCTGWAKKTGPFLRVYNFAMDGARNACDMSKFSKFYLENNIKLACQCVKYSLPNLHKYSVSLKLRWIWQCSMILLKFSPGKQWNNNIYLDTHFGPPCIHLPDGLFITTTSLLIWLKLMHNAPPHGAGYNNVFKWNLV